ncbi:MAG: lamin tail domain-containing protein [Bacteroidales bacterium]|nr:lamin tail domain-containing protein [Bacteroidales bacterium]
MRISEILFNPQTGGSDFVELYNAGSVAVSLGDLYLGRWKTDHVDKLYALKADHTVGAGEYVVLTTDAADLVSRYAVEYAARIVEVSAMPAYGSSQGVVLLCLADSSVVERLDYDVSMHCPLIADAAGVSLERRSFERPSHDRGNWYSAASTAGFATPTYANSQSMEMLFLEHDFSLSSDILSPDADGYQDLLDIGYTLQRPDLMANISFADARGRVVRHLLRNGSLGTHGVLTWDGTDNSGAVCRRGNYVLLIEVYSPRSERQIVKRKVTLIP